MTQYLGGYKLTDNVFFRYEVVNRDGTVGTVTSEGQLQTYKDSQTTPDIGAASGTGGNASIVQVNLSGGSAGFFQAGHEYQVVLKNLVVDGQTISVCVAMFTILPAGSKIGGSRVT